MQLTWLAEDGQKGGRMQIGLMERSVALHRVLVGSADPGKGALGQDRVGAGRREISV